MSGGALNYVYSKVQDAADTLHDSKLPLRRAFALHLTKIATALHDLEWVMSGDRSAGSEEAAIAAVLSKTEEIYAAVIIAKETIQDLEFIKNKLSELIINAEKHE